MNTLLSILSCIVCLTLISIGGYLGWIYYGQPTIVAQIKSAVVKQEGIDAEKEMVDIAAIPKYVPFPDPPNTIGMAQFVANTGKMCMDADSAQGNPNPTGKK